MPVTHRSDRSTLPGMNSSRASQLQAPSAASFASHSRFAGISLGNDQPFKTLSTTLKSIEQGKLPSNESLRSQLRSLSNWTPINVLVQSGSLTNDSVELWSDLCTLFNKMSRFISIVNPNEDFQSMVFHAHMAAKVMQLEEPQLAKRAMEVVSQALESEGLPTPQQLQQSPQSAQEFVEPLEILSGHLSLLQNLVRDQSLLDIMGDMNDVLQSMLHDIGEDAAEAFKDHRRQSRVEDVSNWWDLVPLEGQDQMEGLTNPELQPKTWKPLTTPKDWDNLKNVSIDEIQGRIVQDAERLRQEQQKKLHPEPENPSWAGGPSWGMDLYSEDGDRVEEPGPFDMDGSDELYKEHLPESSRYFPHERKQQRRDTMQTWAESEGDGDEFGDYRHRYGYEEPAAEYKPTSEQWREGGGADTGSDKERAEKSHEQTEDKDAGARDRREHDDRADPQHGEASGSKPRMVDSAQQVEHEKLLEATEPGKPHEDEGLVYGEHTDDKDKEHGDDKTERSGTGFAHGEQTKIEVYDSADQPSHGVKEGEIPKKILDTVSEPPGWGEQQGRRELSEKARGKLPERMRKSESWHDQRHKPRYESDYRNEYEPQHERQRQPASEGQRPKDRQEADSFDWQIPQEPQEVAPIFETFPIGREMSPEERFAMNDTQRLAIASSLISNIRKVVDNDPARQMFEMGIRLGHEMLRRAGSRKTSTLPTPVRDANLDEAGQRFTRVLEFLAQGYSLKRLTESGQEMHEILCNDAYLRSLLSRGLSMLEPILGDSYYRDTDAALESVQLWIKDMRVYLCFNASLAGLVSRSSEELYTFVRRLVELPAGQELRDSIRKVVNDVFDFSASPGITRPRATVLYDFVVHIIPMFVKQMPTIRIPKIHNKYDRYEITINEFQIDTRTVVPGNVRIKEGQELFISLNEDREIAGTIAHELTLYMDNVVHDAIRGIPFVFQTTGMMMPRITDSGRADIEMAQGSGLNLGITLRIKQNMDGRMVLEVTDTTVDLGKLNINVRHSKHRYAYKMLSPMLNRALRAYVVAAIKGRVYEIVDMVNGWMSTAQSIMPSLIPGYSGTGGGGGGGGDFDTERNTVENIDQFMVSLFAMAVPRRRIRREDMRTGYNVQDEEDEYRLREDEDRARARMNDEEEDSDFRMEFRQRYPGSPWERSQMESRFQ